MKTSNYDKAPFVAVKGHHCTAGWKDIAAVLQTAIEEKQDSEPVIVAVECYHGVYIPEIWNCLQEYFPDAGMYSTSGVLRSSQEIDAMVYPYVTDDPVFGYIAPLTLDNFFEESKIADLQKEINTSAAAVVFVVGYGATLVAAGAPLIVYADMPRWEIQLRYRNNSISNLGADNQNADFSYQYKRSFFVDWRVLDKHKQMLMDKWHFVLDTTKPGHPKMITGNAMRDALSQTVQQPFRVVPFFDPGPWGGQWLKEVCDLDRTQQNFAWGFDCVPEENSLLFSFAGVLFETPAINLVFAQPAKLLGEQVYAAFGAEFPIRFDFLDTVEGGNLSLQVHPLQAYIREHFGMGYTQDESYYILDAKENAFVYLGLKENIEQEAMLHDLQKVQKDGSDFDAEQYVAKWPIKKHDHILIPSGTVHCSGADTVVLEISATPYIFTFKLWDWGRMGLDGKPRPISLEHGSQVIQWERTAAWTKEHLINQFEQVAEGDGWIEERTGLDATSFIETRRHWFEKTVTHHTQGIVNVLNLIEGREVIVESTSNAFEPCIIHYAETFIVPANVGAYTIRPYGESEGKRCATIRASIRTENLIDYRIN